MRSANWILGALVLTLLPASPAEGQGRRNLTPEQLAERGAGSGAVEVREGTPTGPGSGQMPSWQGALPGRRLASFCRAAGGLADR